MPRTRNIYDPSDTAPYPLSRSKLELFLECPRCFYLDRRCGIGRPDIPPYPLNLAVDHLLKKEFDFFRASGEPHPVMTRFGIDAVPFRHKDLDTWRDTPTGIRSVHSESNFEVFGLIDDIWQHQDSSLAIVDYKATSTNATLTLDDRDGYKRQLEVYQWLFRRNGFTVSDTAYIVYVNATKDRDMFDQVLEFVFSVHPYSGSDAWIDDALKGAQECLLSEIVPQSVEACEWCEYRRGALKFEQ